MSLIIVASLEHSSARKPYHAMRGCRRIGSPFTGNGTTSTTTASLGSLRVHEKRVIRRWRIIKMTMRASSLPGHILGPLPNGTNVNGAEPAPSKRDGSNFSGSGEYFEFWWVEFMNDTICVCMKHAYILYVMNLCVWIKFLCVCKESWRDSV